MISSSIPLEKTCNDCINSDYCYWKNGTTPDETVCYYEEHPEFKDKNDKLNLKNKIKFSRIFSMPNSSTFEIAPIRNFVKKYLNNSKISIDPFARNQEFATYTNDLDPDTKAKYHLPAEEFLIKLKNDNIKADLIIFDPPYSPRQISECYKNIGKKCNMEDTQSGKLYSKIKNLINDLLEPQGHVLSFGWNSVGMGRKYNYLTEEILLVCHGGAHNDTICLSERKVLNQIF